MEFSFNYPIENLDTASAENIINKTDVLIVTVNEIERENFYKYLLPIPEKKYIAKIIHKKATYHIGRLGFYLVGHVQSAMGSVGRDAAILTVYKAIDFLKPKLVIMVGVAFGINPKKQKIGDVLVSKKIINYEVARVNEGKEKGEYNITPRGDDPQSGLLLYNCFTNILDWNYFLTKKRKASIISGNILSGEKLVDNIEYRNFLKDKFPKTIGGEMEGSGVSSACQNQDLTEWIVIKGICDWADGQKHKGFQPKAAASANSLVFHAFSNPNTFNDLGIFKYTPKVVEKEKEKYSLDASKGSPLWAFNKVRSCVLTMLLKDLKTVQEEGYNKEICLAIKQDLEGLYSEILKLPNLYEGSIELCKTFQKFIDTFILWSSIEGNSEYAKRHRIKHRDELKRIRTNISKIVRLTQKSLSYNIEELNFAMLIGYQKELTGKYSDVFPNLKKTVRKIEKELKRKNKSL